jgi:hypothetical protein
VARDIPAGHRLTLTIVGIADGISSCAAGDLGPGGISAALRAVADDWRDGLNSMADRIGNMAHGMRDWDLIRPPANRAPWRTR